MKELCIIVLIFFSYSFVGWIIEVIAKLIQFRRFINRGFLVGPVCPIYGCGAVLITLLLNRYQEDPVTLFLMSVIICSILEYFTSYIMEKIFKNRWWDYSQRKYNINGRICLECAIPFGIGAVIMFYGINPILINLYSKIPILVLEIICGILVLLLIVDLIISFNVIITLKNVSNSLRSDSTEVITKKVKEILSTKNILYKRLLDSFPKMKVFNKMSILKEKLLNDKKRLKKEKKKVKQNKKKK